MYLVKRILKSKVKPIVNPIVKPINFYSAIVSLGLSVLILNGCSDAGVTTSDPNPGPVEALVEAVPLPEPPAPLTAETQILSGGWLVIGDGSEPMFDSLVVVTDGKIIAIGKRGSVDVPNDSIGVDTSGKWILPGPQLALEAAMQQRDHDTPLQFSDANLSPIAPGRAAELVVFNDNPLRARNALDDIHFQMVAGDIIEQTSGLK